MMSDMVCVSIRRSQTSEYFAARILKRADSFSKAPHIIQRTRKTKYSRSRLMA